MFIDVGVLERRKIEFDRAFHPGSLNLPETWKLKGGLTAAGTAELLDPKSVRAIRVRGHIDGALEGTCGRCLDEAELSLDGDFDLYFYPMSLIARSEETPIGRDDTDLGFYEDPGIELSQVVGEQVALWLPMRCLCGEDCKGICPQCGVNRNRTSCDCSQDLSDSRWDALRKMKLKRGE